MALAPLLTLMALLAAVGWLLQPMLTFIHYSWTDQYGAHSHGYLVLAVACYFAYRTVRSSPGLEVRPAPTVAIPLVAVLAAVVAANVLFMGPTQTLAAPIILGLCTALCLGWAAAWRLAWPILFLYLALPVWGPINPLLQKLTTSISTAMLGLTHIPFYVEGNTVSLASGTFEIASGCSGLNYFLAAATIAATQCTLHLTTTAARVKLMVAGVLAALLANWLRVASLIAIGHITEMRHYLIRVEHFWFGWILFMALLAPVVLYGRRLADGEPADDLASSTVRVPPVRWIWGALAASMIGALTVGVGLVFSLQSLPADFGAGVQQRIIPADQFASGWSPHAAGGDKAEIRLGSMDGLEIYHLKYESQTGEAYLGHPGNSITGEGWTPMQSNLVRLQRDGEVIDVVEHVGRLHDAEGIIWSLPTVGGHMAQSRVRRTAAMLMGRIRGRRDAELWALHAPCPGDCDRARNDLRTALARSGVR